VQPYLDLRYEGTDTILRTKQPAKGSEFEGDYESAFKAEYQREYGFTIKERAVVVDNIRVRAIGVTANVKRIPKLKLDAPFSERKYCCSPASLPRFVGLTARRVVPGWSTRRAISRAAASRRPSTSSPIWAQTTLSRYGLLLLLQLQEEKTARALTR
jgi:hypothetical protein